MRYETMTEQQVAAYLKLDLREVQKLASRGQIPCRKVAGRFQFLKAELDHWVESRMHRLDRRELEGIERGVSEHHGMEGEGPLICPMIPPGGIAVPLEARTRDAVLRGLVDLADAAGMVHGREDLIREVRHREDLCTTALMPGVAMPHPRHPLPYDIAASFVVVGLTASGIPFGAIDGSLTRLFFLICCKDDRTHLHVLARLGQIFHEPAVVEELLAAADADELGRVLLRHEGSAIARQERP